MRNTQISAMQRLDQGEAFLEFRGLETLSVVDSIRIINTQSEVIVENLNGMRNTVHDRRQTILYLLEQCILVPHFFYNCIAFTALYHDFVFTHFQTQVSAAVPTKKPKQRNHFRSLRRLVEKARRFLRRGSC
jgi:hypothetical protein